ncbi:MAG: hypothetical protein KJ709_05340, partial [Nanoarchaeota archaeon]|nr:hypothetical protein [Nanoarchaeota archaeon]
LDEIRKLIPRINSASKRFTKTFKATVSDAVKVSKQEDRLFYKIARAEQAGRQLVRDTLADIVNRERKKTRRMLEKGKLTEAQAKKRLTEVKKITVELDRRNDSHWQELRRQLNEELDKFTEKSRRQLGNASTIGKVVDLREFVNKLDTPAVARRIKVAARAVKDDRLAEIPLEKSIKRSRDFQSFERNVAQLYALYHDEIHRTASIAEMAKVLFHRLPTSLAELQSIQTLTGNKRKVRLHLDDILRYLAKMLRKVERQDTMLEHEVAAA